MKYETKAGIFSEGDTFMKIIDLLDQLIEQLMILGHYKKENNDELIGQGFIGIGEMIQKVRVQVTRLATGKIRMQ